MTSETEEPASEAPVEELEEKASKRFAHTLTPANETAPPPPPEPANSDLETEVDGPAPAQEWPLAWLRLVEPEPEVEPEPPTPGDEVVAAVIAAEPLARNEVVAAVIAAEPADSEGVAHAFGRAMAAALDVEPELEAETAAELAGRAFYSVPVDEAPDASVGEPLEPSAAEAGDDAHAPAAEPSPAADAPEKTVAEPEEPPLVTPVYASRRSRARKPAREGEAAHDGKAGEGGPAVAAYLFYLAGFLLIPAVAGMAIAYNARRSAPAWLESHYLFLIRTFWIGVAGAAVAAALLFSGKLTLGGLVLGLLLIVWLEVRSALGFISLVKLRAFPRPRSWLF